MKNRVSVESQSSPSSNLSHLSTLWRTVTTSWAHCQIGHRSQYSVERLLALHDYHERTSTARAVAVCFFTPIPAMAAALAVDCIPLRPPSHGWEANYLLWIRVFIAMFIVSIGLALQVHGVVTRNPFSNIAAVGISKGSAASYVAVSIAAAALIKFPIPFGYVLMVGPYISIFAVFTVCTIGFRVLASSPELRTQLLSQGMIIATQGLVAVAYPIVSAVFIRLTGIQQIAFVLVMPMIKFITKQIIARTVTRIHEYVGPIVVTSAIACPKWCLNCPKVPEGISARIPKS
eukprot:jgi/Phyca11/121612/e_gw1.44.300.1